MLLVGIVGSALLLLLGAGGYLRDPRGSAGLLALRLASVLLLFLVLSGLTFRRDWSRRGSVVAILTDASLSMSRVGADSLAANAVRRIELPAGAQSLPFVFAETTVADADADLLSGDRTLLGRALSAVATHRPGAIVLLSDGRDNGLVDAEAVAVRSGIPVYAVGCGPRAATNFALRRMRIPAEAHSGDTVRVVIEAIYDGEGSVTSVVALEGQQQSVTFEAAGVQEVEFNLVPRTTGFVSLSALAESIPGEMTAADNVLQGLLYVQPSQRRVHFFTGAPGPASRFIVRTLGRIKRLGLEDDLAGVGGVQPGDGSRVYVVDRLQSDADWEKLAAEVRKGAGVLLLGTAPFGKATPAAEFLPGGAVAAPGASGIARVTGTPGVPETWRAIDFGRLPPLRPTVGAASPEGLDAWLEDETSGALLAGTWRIGAGRVVFLGGPVWRWGFLPASVLSGPTALGTILEGAIRFLNTRAEERMKLVPDRPDYLAGDIVRLQLRAVGVDGLPLSSGEARLTVDGRDVPFPLNEIGSGVLEAEIDGLAPGVHEATVALAGASTRTTFSISERSREDAAVGLDDVSLRRLAAATGGEYLDSGHLPGPGFEMRLVPTRHRFEFTPRRTLWVYFLLVALAATEWVLRRRRGLP